MLQDLVRHKVHANNALLKAVQENEAALEDRGLLELLHHIILANRYWFSLVAGRPFVHETESKVPDSLEDVAKIYSETHTAELEWIDRAQDSDLEASIETPFIPGCKFSVAQAILQVCMHSHGHRAQCATKLRAIGGTPPAGDFIFWLRDRSNPTS